MYELATSEKARTPKVKNALRGRIEILRIKNVLHFERFEFK